MVGRVRRIGRVERVGRAEMFVKVDRACRVVYKG
jgi:hypothetical protein